MITHKIVPSLWYTKGRGSGGEVLHVALSAIEHRSGDGHAGGHAERARRFGGRGRIHVVGQPFSAMTAGKLDDFNHAVSFTVMCDDQAEIDKYYDALLADGGKEENCGWVCDKYGLRWQIVPKELNDMTASPDRDRARKAMQAMLKMKRLDIAKLRAAFGSDKMHQANT